MTNLFLLLFLLLLLSTGLWYCLCTMSFAYSSSVKLNSLRICYHWPAAGLVWKHQIMSAWLFHSQFSVSPRCLLSLAEPAVKKPGKTRRGESFSVITFLIPFFADRWIHTPLHQRILVAVSFYIWTGQHLWLFRLFAGRFYFKLRKKIKLIIQEPSKEFEKSCTIVQLRKGIKWNFYRRWFCGRSYLFNPTPVVRRLNSVIQQISHSSDKCYLTHRLSSG